MRLSLETIDYQYKDSFPPALERAIEEIYDGINTHGYKTTQEVVKSHPSVKTIESLIRQRFNLNIEVQRDLHVLSPAAIIPFFGDYYRHDVNHSGGVKDFFNFNSLRVIDTINAIVKDRKATLAKIHDKEGFINTKLARVGGYLAQVRHYLIIDFKWMVDKGITPKELVAIILHEIGHAFDGLEEHYRLDTVNRSILDILVDLNDNKTDSAKYKFKKRFSKSEFDKSHLSNEQERQDFCGELARQYIGQVKSQLPSRKYDETNFENMADTFATRFGMGKYLVSGLDKLMRMSGSVVDNTMTNRVLFYSLDAIVIALAFLIIPVYGAICWAIVMMYLTNVSNDTLTYDKPLERYQRIRNTIVNALKKVDLPKDVLKDLLEQLKYIDETIANAASMTSILELSGNALFANARRDMYYIDLQREIEDNLNNNLYVKSAQLKAT